MHGIDTGPITFINVFEIDHDKVEPFLEGWRERAEFMSKQPGFRSFRLLRALTPDARFQLVNVAEWESATRCTQQEPSSTSKRARAARWRTSR